MTKLFLSYARGDDQPFVYRVHDDLTRAGFDTWVDKDDLRSRGLPFHQEIKDAIRERDRLIFIGGPRSAVSPYVREEWQLALELDKPVVPILRLGEYETSLPGSLALLHCEDFRDDAQYDVQLAKLVANLQLPPPPLGKLFGNLPELPGYFQPRPELLRRVKDALLVDLQKPIVVTDAESRVGIQGMGGIGKSVLAAALARDQEIRRSYPDGVIWVRFGKISEVEKSQRLEQLQRDVVHHLGGVREFSGIAQGKTVLRDLLLCKAVVFVFDDVWSAGDVADFIDLGPRCRALITTRDSGIINTLQGNLFQIALFSESESLELLAAGTNDESSALPAEAREVARECGFLPLALSLCAGMAAKANGRWAGVLERLRRADLDKIVDRQAINPAHRSIWRAIHTSIEDLDEDKQRRFAELSIFGPRGAIPSSAVETLWTSTGAISDLDVDDLLIELRERALVQLDKPSEPLEGAGAQSSIWHVSLHDLLYDYTRTAVGDPMPLHQSLVAAYRGRAPEGWWTVPHDDYILTHLREHLIAAGCGDELIELLHELRWYEAKNAAGLIFDVPHDFRHAMRFLTDARGPQSNDLVDNRGPRLKLLDEALRRDIHFIHRHRGDYPQALFQSMWNHAWWYDAPDADRFLDDGGTTTLQTPTGLYQVLDGWRRVFESNSGGPWVRSLCPPVHRLGSRLQRVFAGHKAFVRSVAFDPTGKLLATGSFDKTVRIWALDTGRELAVWDGYDSPITYLIFSRDGSTLLSQSENSVYVRSVGEERTGSKRIDNIPPFRPHVTTLSADGRWFACLSRDAVVLVCDLNDADAPLEFRDPDSEIRSISISADGALLAAGCDDGTINLWELRAGALRTKLKGHVRGVICLEFSRDGQRLISGGEDQTASVWNVETGGEVAVLEGHEGHVFAARLAANGCRLATVDEGQVRIWDDNYECICSFDCKGHDLDRFEWFPDSRCIALGRRDGTVLNCDSDTRQVLPIEFEKTFAFAVAFDGHLFARANGRTVELWSLDERIAHIVRRSNDLLLAEVETAEQMCFTAREARPTRTAEVKSWLQHIHREITAREVRAISLNRKYSAQASECTITVATDSTPNVVTLDGQGSPITCLAFSNDERRLAAGAKDATIRVWDMDGSARFVDLVGHTRPISHVCFAPNGRRLVTMAGGEIRIWDTETGESVATAHWDRNYVMCLVTSPDSRRVAAANCDGDVGVWDMETGEAVSLAPRTALDQRLIAAGRVQLVSALKAPPPQLNAAFSDDGRRLAVRSIRYGYLNGLWRWDLENGECDVAVLGEGDVAAVARDRIWTVRTERETAVYDSQQNEAVAYHASRWLPMLSVPHNGAWAGFADGNAWQMLKLEGMACT